MHMKILNTFSNAQFGFVETKYRKKYPTLIVKHSEFFNSSYTAAYVPVPIGYTYTRTNGET